MTKLLDEVVRKIGELSDERQNDAAHVLLAMLENDAPRYRLTDSQLGEVRLSITEADEGKFASEKALAEALDRPWA